MQTGLTLFTIIFSLFYYTLQFEANPKEEKRIQSTLYPNYFEDDRGIIIINDENYDNFIRDFNVSLLFSYRNPCKFCYQIYPELEKIINPLRYLQSPVIVAKLNITEGPNVAKRLNLNSPISLKYISEEMPMEYNGGRTGEEIVSWVRAKFDPIIGEIKNVEEIDQLRKITETLMIFFGEDMDKYSEYFNAVRGKEDIIFAKCPTQLCLLKYSVGNGDIMVFKKSEGNQKPSILRSEEYNKENISKKLDDLAREKIMKFNIKVATYIFAEENPALFLYRSKSDSELYDNLLLEVFDEAFKNNLKLVTTDIVDSHEMKLAQILGFDTNDLPRIVIHDTGFPTTVKSYVMDKSKTINKDNISEFIQDFNNKRIPIYLKSKPVPQNQTDSSYNLVGSTIEKFVNDENKDVLVMFYAPWCKNSKILYPIYEKIAEKLKNLPNFLIAKLDAFNNDAGVIDIEYYPTIAIWPSYNKSKPILFEGDYSKEKNIMNFIRENAYHKNTFIDAIDQQEEKEDTKNSAEISDEMIKLVGENEENKIKNASEF